MTANTPVATLRPVGETAACPTGIGGALARVATALRLPLNRELAMLAHWRALRTHPVWHNPPLHAGGQPVLVVGGMGSSAIVLAPLQYWLHRVGARPVLAPIGFGVGCGERIAHTVERTLVRLTEAAGEPAVVLAHSRGGQFARAVAVRRPELTRGLITLGSPLNRLLAVHPIVKAHVVVLGLAGTVGVPWLMRAGCLWGGCCRQLRADLAAPFPARVPFVSIYSQSDRIVDWRSSLDPGARHVEVDSSHTGLITDPEVFAVLSQELRALQPQPLTPVRLAV